MMMIHMDAGWDETKNKNCDIRIRQTLEQEIEKRKERRGGGGRKEEEGKEYLRRRGGRR